MRWNRQDEWGDEVQLLLFITRKYTIIHANLKLDDTNIPLFMLLSRSFKIFSIESDIH